MTLFSEATKHPQQVIKKWLLEVLGYMHVYNKEERALRFLEEAVELVQACGIQRDKALRVLEYVYDRPIGKASQEIGGAQLTLYALGEALGIDIQSVCVQEILRVHKPEVIERVRSRQEEKLAAFVTSESKESK